MSSAIRLGPSQFESRYGSLFRSIFRGTTARRASFCKLDWDIVLTAGLFFERRTDDYPLRALSKFGALRTALRATGDDRLIVSDIVTTPQHQWACLVPCDWDEYVNALFGPEPDTVLFAFGRAIFSPNGQWGAITHQQFTDHPNMPHYAILGGTRNFMDIFIDGCGGREELRRGFVDYLNFEPLSDWPSLPDDVKDTLLADAGWRP